MARPVKITTPFPTVLETAKRLGVSKRDALILSEAAERSVKTGVFEIPGVGRVRMARKARTEGNPKTGQNRARGVDRRILVQNRSRSRKKS
jgi:hypothetical protein